MTDIPADVLDWVRRVFAECNRRVTDRLDRNPNAPEESFDLTWIEHVGRYASPAIFASDWTAKVETHYLGGLRHYGTWEIADIGILVFLRLAPGVRTNKVALLQSKRLYPSNAPVRDDTRPDYVTGFARLADPENASLSIGQEADFSFSSSSRYGALLKNSAQVGAIFNYEAEQHLRIYYQFYNPWRVPMAQRIPLAGYETPDGLPDLGVRLLPAIAVRGAMDGGGGASPTLDELGALDGFPAHGWRLEDFIVDELLGCREGDQFASTSDERVQSLFYRRSGPIAAAIAITIEAPGAVAA